MSGVQKIAVLGLLALFLGYFSHVRYPEACDFPIGIKAFYSLTRLATHVSDFVHYIGGNYVTLFRLLEFDFSGSVEGVEVTNDILGGIPTTIFKPTDFAASGARSAIIYYHGGGWAVGSVGLYASFMKALTKNSGMIIIFPEYRLAPEHPYPIPFEDCVSATLDFYSRLEEFNVDPKKIIFAGDSAGGNLATAISLHLGKRKNVTKPCMINVIYPVLQMSNLRLPSYQQNSDPPLADPELMAHFFLLYMGMPNETRLINSMLSGLHMKGLESDTFAGKIDQALIPEKYKKKSSSSIERKLSGKDHALMEKFSGVLQGYATDPKFAPLAASDDEIIYLPKAYIVTCQYDILRDDGIILHERMKALGMDAKLDNLEFGAHGVFNLYGSFEYKKMDDAVLRMINNMKTTLSECQAES